MDFNLENYKLNYYNNCNNHYDIYILNVHRLGTIFYLIKEIVYYGSFTKMYNDLKSVDLQ